MNALLARVDRDFLLAVAGPVPATKKSRQLEIIAATARDMPSLMERFKIDTLYRICHFVAQLAHESDGFCTTREYASGAAYEGRADLGNTRPGDGRRYPGRGEIQNTGRANARNFTLWMRSFISDAPDFEAYPDQMEEFPWAVWVSIWFWDTRSLNVLADRDDLLGITKKINGGKNGLDDRQRKLNAAEKFMAVKAVVVPIAAEIISKRQNDFPVLYIGIKGSTDVEHLQRCLTQAGYYHGAIDGNFGAGTEGAVKAFQARLKLDVDGIAGERTIAALSDLLKVHP